MTIAERRLRGTAVLERADKGETPQLGTFASLVAGTRRETGKDVAVRSPYDDQLAAIVHRAGPEEIEAAIAASAAAFRETRKLPSWQREQVLESVAATIAERASFTFKVAAEEAKRIYGEIVPLDWIPGAERRVAHVRRVPIGPIAGITPFNFPLMLVAHKVAPALAAGNPIIVRPASQTPVSALRLGGIV